MIFFSLQFRKVDWLWPFRLALHRRALSRPLHPTWIIFHFAFWMNRSSAIFGYSRTLLLRSCLLWFSAADRYIFSFFSALNIEQAGASRICWDHQQESTDGEASRAGARERNSIKFCYMTQRHLSKPFIDFDYERNFFSFSALFIQRANFKSIFSLFCWRWMRNGSQWLGRAEERRNRKYEDIYYKNHDFYYFSSLRCYTTMKKAHKSITIHIFFFSIFFSALVG